MAISETAQKNHDELFPGHVSTLADTDPELIEVDPRTRLMVQLAALISARTLSEYRVMLGAPSPPG